MYPRWLKSTAIAIGVIAIGAFITDALSGPGYPWLSRVSGFATVVTLIVLLFYAHDTHLIATEAWMPSAKFWLAPVESGSGSSFLIANHCKKTLRCRCDLNITVNGKPVHLGGFYSGESYVDVQPLGTFTGYFDVHDIISKAGETYPAFQDTESQKYGPGFVNLDIDFKYSEWDKELFHATPTEPFYFDFRLGVFISRR